MKTRTFLQKTEALHKYLQQTQQKTLLQKLQDRMDLIAKSNFKYDAIDQSYVLDIMKKAK